MHHRPSASKTKRPPRSRFIKALGYLLFLLGVALAVWFAAMPPHGLLRNVFVVVIAFGLIVSGMALVGRVRAWMEYLLAGLP